MVSLRESRTWDPGKKRPPVKGVNSGLEPDRRTLVLAPQGRRYSLLPVSQSRISTRTQITPKTRPVVITIIQSSHPTRLSRKG